MNFLDWTPEYFINNESDCLEKLNDINKTKTIPSLNHTTCNQLTDGCLVRFRGLIQQRLGIESYAEEFQIQYLSDDLTAPKFCSRTQNAKYIDFYQLNLNEVIDRKTCRMLNGERRDLILISVPGVNEWVLEEEKKIYNVGDKLSTSTSSDQCQLKSSVSGSNPEDSNESNSKIASEHLLSSPIPSRPSKTCYIKIYTDFERFKLNTMVDVIGFLTIKPLLKLYEYESYQETETIQLPPRIHAIWMRELQHINPLLLENQYLPINALIAPNDYIEESYNPQNIYKELKTILTQLLFNDGLAANYLIYHLLSKIYVRTDTDTWGAFTLNISHIPISDFPEYAASLYEIIEMLLPASHYFPLTLDNLNKTTFFPKKDFKTNKLVSGLFQLAPHTHLTLDDTHLKIDLLEVKVADNIRHINQLINTQQIRYDYPVDLQILVLSKNISRFRSNFHVPLVPDMNYLHNMKDTLIEVKHFLKLKLNIFRKYLTLQRIKKITMTHDMCALIQEECVQMHNGDKSVYPIELHNIMVLSRLIGLSRDRSRLDAASLYTAMDMEVERKKRLDLMKVERYKK